MAVGDGGLGLTDWAGNRTFRAARLHEPRSIEELADVVRGARSLRVLGSRHSFSDIADTTGDLVSLARMPRRFDLDPAAGTLTVDGGVRYGDLCRPLDAAGFALHNLASLPHISVAGACATATHGSGDRNGNLATAVRALEVLTPDAETTRFAPDLDHEAFDGAVVALGGLGVVVALTLAVEPAYRMRQDVYEDLPLDVAAERFDEITGSADSVSLFTEWRGPSFEQVWFKRRVSDAVSLTPEPTVFGATRATVPIHPVRRLPAGACTEQLGVAGPWYERLPHFRMDHTPSAGAELQSEYLLDRRHAADALVALERVRGTFAPLLQVSEVRTAAADELWLSTAYGRPSVAIHFTWRPDWESVRRVLPTIEDALAPFDPRPHWGKLSTLPAERVRASYERLGDFAALLGRHDPEGVFRNGFLDRYVFGTPSAR